MQSLYDKRPVIKTNGWCITGWQQIRGVLENQLVAQKVLVVDCYTGVYFDELKTQFSTIENRLFIDTSDLFKPESAIREMTVPFVTDDVLFGYLTPLTIEDYFDTNKLEKARKMIFDATGPVVIFGYGAAQVVKGDITLFADMPRWEIQQRMRRKEVNGLGVENKTDYISRQYKRGYFNDWKILDRHKQTLYESADYWLDTTDRNQPRMIDQKTFFTGLSNAVLGPFRVVPFFDPAPWGGQWMKQVCNLDTRVKNFGWCFDCVPEENSLLLEIEGTQFEMPAINLVYVKTRDLLGEKVEARFGKEFPIRFDLLDTMDGGNLSLQVHPTTEYVHNHFGIHYTQDESYYLIDAKDDGAVYLGVTSATQKDSFLRDLERASNEKDCSLNAEKYVNKFSAKKHDHFLIPAGTIHCSAKNTVVLEISATPNLFTFKLWDWNRLGLDGKPRPINIDRGKEVIQWHRDKEYTKEHLVNVVSKISEGDGWVEEQTGLHPTQFIETRRHSFTKKVFHQTNGSVNVLHLAEGETIIVESTDLSFEPFVVHYAETFIIPARINEYTVRPYGKSEEKECITIKAYVRC